MTYIKVYGDGTTYPRLEAHDLVIRIRNGAIEVGYARAAMKGTDALLLEEITISAAATDAIRSRVTEENPDVMLKKHTVYLLCPPQLKKQYLQHIF